MIDVNPNYLDTVTRILAGHVPECEVRAFGSRVTWTAKDYSDLDLAVVGERALDSDNLRRLREAFEESDLPFRVDVLDWHAISPAFRKVIEEKYEVVQKGKKARLGVAGEWRERLLAELTDNFDGIRVPVKESDRRDGPYPYYGASGVVDHVDNYLFDGEYLLIAEDGENLRTRNTPFAFLARGKFWVNNHAHIVRGNSEADTRFLMYALSSADISGYLTGSTMPKLTQGNMNRISLLTPLLSEQRAIAHILGTLDDKIELNRRMNETLEAMARALFKSWFVDFDPVRAKAEGRDPGLPKPLADLFPDSFEDSELGEIPGGWRVGSLVDEFDLTMGQSPPGETYNKAGVGLPFYQGCTDFGFRFPSRRIYCTSPTRLGKAGDTLVSVRAPVGDINMATEDCAIGRGVAAVRHKTGSRSYSYQFMQSIEEVFARFEAEGTVFGSIGKKDFHAIACVNPPRELVLAYEARVSPLDDRVEVAERESHTLAALRDTLLPKLISGELRLKDAERFVGRAV